MTRIRSGGSSLLDAVVEEVRAERKDSLSGPDSPEGRALGAAVGRNVARYRTSRRLKIATLAERSGIRADLLKALENGESDAHLSSALFRLSRGKISRGKALRTN